MRALVVISFILVHSSVQSQTFNRLYDLGNYSSDYFAGLHPAENFVLVASRHLNLDTGGYIVAFLDRSTGDLLRSIPFLKMDTIIQPYSILQTGGNEWMVCGAIVPYSGGSGSYFTHSIDSLGQTIAYKVFDPIEHETQLWDACKTGSGILMAGHHYYSAEGRNKGLLYFIGLDGEYKWSQVLLDSVWTTSTRCLCISDTLYVVVTENFPVSTRVNHLLKMDTLGNILSHKRIDEIVDMLVSDMDMSADSTEILFSGYQAITGGSKPAMIVLDRALNVKRSKIYNIGDGALGRAAVFTSDDKVILTGHGRDRTLFDNFDNAFVLRVDRSTLLAEALYWYTPSGVQADGKVQIMTRAELNNGQLFVAGHGGIVDTSFSQDAWLLALNEDGTCDSASCYPWLFTGIEGLPFEALHAFKAWAAASVLTVSISDPILLHTEARLVVMNTEGRIRADVPLIAARQDIPTSGWPSGIYFVNYYSPEGRMVQRVWVP